MMPSSGSITPSIPASIPLYSAADVLAGRVGPRQLRRQDRRRRARRRAARRPVHVARLGQGQRRLYSRHRRRDAEGRRAGRSWLGAGLPDRGVLVGAAISRRAAVQTGLLGGGALLLLLRPAAARAQPDFRRRHPWPVRHPLGRDRPGDAEREAPRPDQHRQRPAQPQCAAPRPARAGAAADRCARAQLSADRLDPVARPTSAT